MSEGMKTSCRSENGHEPVVVGCGSDIWPFQAIFGVRPVSLVSEVSEIPYANFFRKTMQWIFTDFSDFTTTTNRPERRNGCFRGIDILAHVQEGPGPKHQGPSTIAFHQ